MYLSTKGDHLKRLIYIGLHIHEKFLQFFTLSNLYTEKMNANRKDVEKIKEITGTKFKIIRK